MHLHFLWHLHLIFPFNEDFLELSGEHTEVWNFLSSLTEGFSMNTMHTPDISEIYSWQLASDIVSNAQFINHVRIIVARDRKINNYWLVIQESWLRGSTTEIWPNVCYMLTSAYNPRNKTILLIHLFIYLFIYLFTYQNRDDKESNSFSLPNIS
jgi:hypothetical protein